MNFYETMYIIHPALQAGRLEDMIDNVHKKIDSLEGKRLYYDNWGKKKLSYAIDKQKYGTYVLMQFTMDGVNVQELSNEFEHNANILRYLTNRIDETEILEQKEDIKKDHTSLAEDKAPITTESSQKTNEKVEEESNSSKEEKNDSKEEENKSEKTEEE